MSNSWHSYPSIYNLGHKAIADLFSVPVDIEEKIDGSQFSFGIFEGTSEPVELRIRSKGAVMHPDAPEKMFAKAAESVKSRMHLLHPGWTYRAEYLLKPKHNALAYDRIPEGHLIIFDINIGEEDYLSWNEKRAEAGRIGLECVPLLGTFVGNVLDELRNILDNTISVLGGQKIEGVVCKQSPPVTLFGRDKKALMGKFVSEAYKEVHKIEWKQSNPTKKDVMAMLGDQYASPARWAKAVQHLRDAGQLEQSPRDIGKILAEIPKDIQKECEEEIKEALWKFAWPEIRRRAIRGAPEWYKEQLLKLQFEADRDL